MTNATVVDRIVWDKLAGLPDLKARSPLEELRSAVRSMPPTRPLGRALCSTRQPALIAEIKRASPSRGIIRPELSPAQVARLYHAGGASAVSVLTEERYFLGNPEYVAEARAACPLPILRKDFVVDPWQVYETRAMGADAVLLIAAILEASLLNDLMGLALSIRLECLIEVHNEADLEKVPPTAELVGVNSRDLRTFHTDLAVAERMLPLVRAHGGPRRIAVAESGVFTRADAERVWRAGAHAVLVGEAIMREGDVEAKVRELVGNSSPPASQAVP